MVTRIGGFDVNKWFITLLIIFVALQAGSYVYSEIAGSSPLKLGWAFFLMLIIVAIISLYTLSKKIGSLESKDIIFIILEFASMIALFHYLPKLIPPAFSVFSP